MVHTDRLTVIVQIELLRIPSTRKAADNVQAEAFGGVRVECVLPLALIVAPFTTL
jgi:hypothetical protein